MRVFLGLGSNRPFRGLDPEAILLHAVDELRAGLGDLRLSRIWITKPRHISDQPDFHNAVVTGSTDLSARELLALAAHVETTFGRDRSQETPKGPRSLDVDILLYGSAIIVQPDLIIPHPLMRERRFVLVPLVSLDPSIVDPVSGQRFSEILASLPPQGLRLAQVSPSTVFYP